MIRYPSLSTRLGFQMTKISEYMEHLCRHSNSATLAEVADATTVEPLIFARVLEW